MSSPPRSRFHASEIWAATKATKFMKVELHINGNLSLELVPETEIERLVLKNMREGAAKGKAVTLRGGGIGRSEELCVIEVEK